MTKKSSLMKIVEKYRPKNTTIEYTSTIGKVVKRDKEYFCFVPPIDSERNLAICLHEFGHIVIGKDETWSSFARACGVLTEEVQNEEIEAWKFALKVMKKEEVDINKAVRRRINKSLRSYKISVKEFWRNFG